MTELGVGSEFAGHRIESTAGRGGMGIVYRALDIRLNRTVAMKLITPDLAGDPEFRKRFESESQLAASIDHTNVIPIHHAGEEEGVLYITMRYVEGTDLAALIAREGRVDPARAVMIVAGVAGALDAAHEHGLIHRDVKPANILIEQHPDRPEHVYLTDFGLTKQAGSSGPTRTGFAVGTFDYMAPEQFLAKPIDARADVYALGCVLFEALTGRVPFPRPGDAARMYAHIQEDPPLPTGVAPELPPRIDDVVRTALAKEPADRFQTAGEVADAAAEAIGVVAPPPQTPLPSRPPAAAPTIIGDLDTPAAAESDPGETKIAPAAEGVPPMPPTSAPAPAEASGTVGSATAESGRSGGRRWLPFALVAGAIAAIAIAVALLAGGGGSDDLTTPDGTVTAFLDRIANGDGDGACELLAPAARQQALNAPGSDCAEGIIQLTGRDNASDKADSIRNARFTVQQSGDQATVSIQFPDPQVAIGSGTRSITVTCTKNGTDWQISDIRSLCLANNFPC